MEGFYKIMPMADAFLRGSESNRTSEEERERITDELWKHRYSILEYTNYDTTRVDRVEDDLAIKSLFILKQKAKKTQTYQSVLKYLAADQTSLFLEGDRDYRNGKYNKPFESGKKKTDRELHSEPIIEACIAAAVDTFNRSCLSGRTREESELAESIIRKIAQYVQTERNGKNMERWLFKAEHLGVTDQNREEYENECNKYAIEFPLGITRTKEKKIIKVLREKRRTEGIFETPYWMVSPTLLRQEVFLIKAFETAFSDEKRKDAFAFLIIQALVFGYISYEKFLSVSGWGIAPKNRRTITYNEAKEFIKFKNRLNHLSELENGYLEIRKSVLTEQDNFDSVASRSEKYDKYSEGLVEIVVSYYVHLGISLKPEKSTTELLTRRIADVIDWAVKKQKETGHNLAPIAILYMVKSCGLNIFHDRHVEVNLGSTHARFRKDLPQRIQRFEEIQLLYNISTFLYDHPLERIPGKRFKLTESDIFLNYQEYLLRQGWEIKSKQEMVLWRTILRNKCHEVPLIGYQIKFLDYVSCCLPYHFEFLPYKTLGPYNVQPNEFYKLYSQKKRYYKSCANKIDTAQNDESEIIKIYKIIWSNFSVKYDVRRADIRFFVKLPFPLMGFPSSPKESSDGPHIDIVKDCEYYEYCRSIVTEMIMQMALNRIARKKLVDLFSKVYGVSLKHALYDDISLSALKNSGDPGDSPGSPDQFKR